MDSLTLFSPAKINEFFRVLRKREDGYHDIVSLVQCLNFGDTLTLMLGDGLDLFTCNDVALAWNPGNLVYRAVELFKKNTHLKFSTHIHLEKKIPMQAGLGGGSSNAATTLYALNQLLDTQLSDSTLAEWGAELGADVPCFFSLGRVLCEGIGEQLTRLPLEEHSYWIAKPKHLSLATPAVYGQCKVGLNASRPLHSLFVNDLEYAAFQILPVLEEFKKQCFNLGFEQVVMTGSGTAFLCQGVVREPVLHDMLLIPVTTHFRLPDAWYPLV